MALVTGPNPPPIPADTPLVDLKTGIMDWFWVQWFVGRDALIQASARTIATSAISAQDASVGATPLDVGNAAAQYQINVYSRITRAATTSSSLIVTIAWTEGGIALAKAFPAMVTNLTTEVLTETFPIRVDASTAVTYATTYVSVGGTTMTYALEVAVERLA